MHEFGPMSRGPVKLRLGCWVPSSRRKRQAQPFLSQSVCIHANGEVGASHQTDLNLNCGLFVRVNKDIVVLLETVAVEKKTQNNIIGSFDV